jgi:protein involved in polysaccharide export with SLBB domain
MMKPHSHTLLSLLWFSLSLNAQTVSSNSSAVIQNYLLRPSDHIQVQVFLEPELTVQTRIEADGIVNLQLIKPFRIAGLTISQAQQEIDRRYYDEEFLWHPRTTVSVLSYSPRKVSVLGEVTRPGFVQIAPDRQLTLIEAISSSGDFTRAADKSRVQLKRQDGRGRLQVYTYDVAQIINNPAVGDIPLQDADIISIPELREKVNVLGAVGRPGFVMIPSEEELSIVEAISAAGGFSRIGNPKKVQLKSKDAQGNIRTIEVDVNRQIQNSDSRAIILNDGDIIYVPEIVF